ncbi:MAG: YfiR family protein [Acidobacteria bacterium]|nr:YfiR family protein [Acidobacteriota bacterium]MBI3425664.1 YfiR family protein [Acidobacteriota bacterium]
MAILTAPNLAAPNLAAPNLKEAFARRSCVAWRRRACWVSGVFLLGALVASFGPDPQQALAQAASEYQVKAAFLFNFAKFVEWPAETFNDASAPFVIGLLGDDPFGNTLDQAINGKAINGHPLLIKRLKRGQNLRGCHILFISSSERGRWAQIFESLRGASVLTIGEAEQFTEQGGLINFVIEGGKVRFEINAEPAEQCHLKISSRLQILAKPARGGQAARRE